MYRDDGPSGGRYNGKPRRGFSPRQGGGYGGRGSYDRSEPIREENQPVPFEKNFYVPTKTLNEEQTRKLRADNNMRLSGEGVMPPVEDFSSLGFPEDVVRYFASKGYTTPTAIQAQGWPMALSGRDMVGIADTGSGKTISFVIPAMIHAKAQQPLRPKDGPIALILAPTRELCNQIETVVSEYTRYFGLRSLAVYGGAAVGPQKRAILSGVEILVATPGRLIDLHDQGFCPLGRVTFLVLDEADRMLDMGFEPQLQRIIPKTNLDRQTLMWSATWPKEVRRLAQDYMKDYIQVTIGSDDLKANVKIVQDVVVVDWREKRKILCSELVKHKDEKVIVFCNTKRMCDEIEDALYNDGFRAAAIHGDKSQAARDTVIERFKSGRNTILIATDVAARGLDINDVKLVINYDFPKCVDDYVHRIGRTARGSSKEGFSFTMLTRDDRGNVRKLVDILRQGNQNIREEVQELASSRYGGSQGRGYGSGRGSNMPRSRRFGY